MIESSLEQTQNGWKGQACKNPRVWASGKDDACWCRVWEASSSCCSFILGHLSKFRACVGGLGLFTGVLIKVGKRASLHAGAFDGLRLRNSHVRSSKLCPAKPLLDCPMRGLAKKLGSFNSFAAGSPYVRFLDKTENTHKSGNLFDVLHKHL